MKSKLNRQAWPEWLILDSIFLISMMTYIITQIIVNGYVADILFIVLLCAATVFLNYRQVNLYHVLTNANGKKILSGLVTEKVFHEQITSIFLTRTDNYIAIIFATLFALVMWQFKIWEEQLFVKCSFSLFIFAANIPTGYAIVRLLKYFYYNVLWINKIDFGIGFAEHVAERFIKKVCTKVLFTAVSYCTISLSSILFTQIELNIIVLFYTIFAASLVLAVLVINNVLLRNKKQAGRMIVIDKINNKMSELFNKTISGEGKNSEIVEEIKELIEIKNCFKSQIKNKFDISKVFSNLGVLFITVIPIVLQWLLDHFN